MLLFNSKAVLSQWQPGDATVKFDTYRNLLRHRAVLPAIARRLVFTFLHQLFELVLYVHQQVLYVPVERVLSQSGLFMRPRVATMSNVPLEALVFLKYSVFLSLQTRLCHEADRQ